MEHYLELVRQAKQGDADAFARLYQEVYEDLYRFAVYILKDRKIILDRKEIIWLVAAKCNLFYLGDYIYIYSVL